MLIFESARRVGRAHLPEWFCASAGIYEFGLVAAIAAHRPSSFCFAGRPILLCCDNSAAASSPVRGSESGVGSKLAAVFRAAASARRAPVRIEEVRAEMNNADPPVRAQERIYIL